LCLRITRLERAQHELQRIPPILRARERIRRSNRLRNEAAAEPGLIAHELARAPALKPTVTFGRDGAGTSDARSRGIDAQRMTPTSAAAVHERFRAIVARTIARIEREEMAHLVALAAPPPKRRRCAPKRHLNLRKG